jgi:hypothetical protein
MAAIRWICTRRRSEKLGESDYYSVGEKAAKSSIGGRVFSLAESFRGVFASRMGIGHRLRLRGLGLGQEVIGTLPDLKRVHRLVLKEDSYDFIDLIGQSANSYG